MSNALEERLKALKAENDAMVSKLLTEHGNDVFNPPYDLVNIPLGRFILQFENEDSIESCRGELISEMYPEILKIIELPPATK